jgi:hypothetical protein
VDVCFFSYADLAARYRRSLRSLKADRAAGHLGRGRMVGKKRLFSADEVVAYEAWLLDTGRARVGEGRFHPVHRRPDDRLARARSYASAHRHLGALAYDVARHLPGLADSLRIAGCDTPLSALPRGYEARAQKVLERFLAIEGGQ